MNSPNLTQGLRLACTYYENRTRAFIRPPLPPPPAGLWSLEGDKKEDWQAMTRPNILNVIYSQGIHKKPDTIVQAYMYMQHLQKICV
jgi:hypothetical protein